MNYKISPHCGAALDPGERCDCEHDNDTRDTHDDNEQEETHGADQRKHQHDNSAA